MGGRLVRDDILVLRGLTCLWRWGFMARCCNSGLNGGEEVVGSARVESQVGAGSFTSLRFAQDDRGMCASFRVAWEGASFGMTRAYFVWGIAFGEAISCPFGRPPSRLGG